MKRYQKYYKNLCELLNTEEIRGGKSLKLEVDQFMDLSVEALANYQQPEDSSSYTAVSLCHYGKQNGDMMRDPEVCFRIIPEAKEAIPCYFRNDYVGKEEFIPFGYRSKGLDQFCDVWFRNLKEQGFFDVNK